MAMATYFALSTENLALCGWTILAAARTAAEARRAGEQQLPRGLDLRADTWRKNFRVVSETVARRRLHAGRAIDVWLTE